MIVNIVSLIGLGIVLQIGGAYIVNAAVNILGSGTSAAAQAANEYSNYMSYIQSFEPRQIVHAVFVAPIVEELVFRLIFLRAGKLVMPFWLANIAQALLFAIYHNVTIQRVYVFVMGLIIGCVFYYCPIIYRKKYSGIEDSDSSENNKKTGAFSQLLDLPNSIFGVALTIILHMVINVAGLFLAPLMPADIANSLQLTIGSMLMLIATAAVVSLYLKQK